MLKQSALFAAQISTIKLNCMPWKQRSLQTWTVQPDIWLSTSKFADAVAEEELASEVLHGLKPYV
jgi:hypothetical protein